jgi:hypothetical protein
MPKGRSDFVSELTKVRPTDQRTLQTSVVD